MTVQTLLFSIAYNPVPQFTLEQPFLREQKTFINIEIHVLLMQCIYDYGRHAQHKTEFMWSIMRSWQ